MTRVGQTMPAVVLSVDKERGYVNRSKKGVSEEDNIQASGERYNKSKPVHSIMRHVAQITSIDVEV